MRIQVLQVQTREGIGKVSKNAYKMDICKCVVTRADGSVEVGEVILPKDHPKIVAGLYDASLDVVSRGGNLDFVIRQMAPVVEARQTRAA